MSVPHLEYGGKCSLQLSFDFNNCSEEEWKTRRQSFSRLVSAAKLSDYEPIQLKVAHTMLLSILDKPDKAVFFFYECTLSFPSFAASSDAICRMMGQLMLTLIYGISQLPDGESHMGLAERALGGILFTFTLTFTRDFHTACLVNDISRESQIRRRILSQVHDVLGYVPLPEWLFPIKKKSRLNREDVERQTVIPYEETKRQMVSVLPSSTPVFVLMRTF